jgi:hypothetical protein
VRLLQCVIFAPKFPIELVKILSNLAECQWFMLVILDTQEEDIRRIAVQSQPGQIVLETLS